MPYGFCVGILSWLCAAFLKTGFLRWIYLFFALCLLIGKDILLLHRPSILFHHVHQKNQSSLLHTPAFLRLSLLTKSIGRCHPYYTHPHTHTYFSPKGIIHATRHLTWFASCSPERIGYLGASFVVRNVQSLLRGIADCATSQSPYNTLPDGFNPKPGITTRHHCYGHV